MYRVLFLIALTPVLSYGSVPEFQIVRSGIPAFTVSICRPLPPISNPVPKVEAKPAKPTGKSIGFGNVWVESHSGTTSDSHLINIHGYTAGQIKGMTQDQKNRLHGYAHEHQSKQTFPTFQKTYSSGCPNGNCPLQRSSR